MYFSDVLQVGLPLPDFLDMNYNLAKLDVVGVRKGAGEGHVSQHFWQMSDEPKPASFSLEGVGLRRAGAVSTIPAIPLTILHPAEPVSPPLARASPEGNMNSAPFFSCHFKQITSLFSMPLFFCAENGDDTMGPHLRDCCEDSLK